MLGYMQSIIFNFYYAFDRVFLYSRGIIHPAKLVAIILAVLLFAQGNKLVFSSHQNSDYPSLLGEAGQH